MRASSLILALPAVAAAQQFAILDQVKGFFAKATDSLSSAVASATQSINIPNPAASAAAKIAGLNVRKLTLENHEELLRPGAATSSPGFEAWFVYVRGCQRHTPAIGRGYIDVGLDYWRQQDLLWPL